MFPTWSKGEYRLYAIFVSSTVRMIAVLLHLSLQITTCLDSATRRLQLLMTGQLASSLVALLTAHSSIFHDHDLTRASKTDEYVILCKNERMCLCSWSAYIDTSLFFPAHSNPERSIHFGLKVYTLISSKNPIPKSFSHPTLPPTSHALWSCVGPPRRTTGGASN